MSNTMFLLCIVLFLFSSCQNNDLQLDANFYKTIGAQIRQERLNQGYSQQALADSINISQNSLSLIEDGLATPIHTKLMDIENFLKVEFIIEGQQMTIKQYIEQETLKKKENQ